MQPELSVEGLAQRLVRERGMRLLDEAEAQNAISHLGETFVKARVRAEKAGDWSLARDYDCATNFCWSVAGEKAIHREAKRLLRKGAA